jgi:hypothetical protein
VLSRIIALSLALASVGVLGAQAPASEPTVDVVSVKPVKAPTLSPRGTNGFLAGGRYERTVVFLVVSLATLLYAVPLVTALRDQLGLRLESATGPIDIVVIDHVERPTQD